MKRRRRFQCWFCDQPPIESIGTAPLCARHLGLVNAIAEDARTKPRRMQRRVRKPIRRPSPTVATDG